MQSKRLHSAAAQHRQQACSDLGVTPCAVLHSRRVVHVIWRQQGDSAAEPCLQQGRCIP